MWGLSIHSPLRQSRGVLILTCTFLLQPPLLTIEVYGLFLQYHYFMCIAMNNTTEGILIFVLKWLTPVRDMVFSWAILTYGIGTRGPVAVVRSSTGKNPDREVPVWQPESNGANLIHLVFSDSRFVHWSIYDDHATDREQDGNWESGMKDSTFDVGHSTVFQLKITFTSRGGVRWKDF